MPAGGGAPCCLELDPGESQISVNTLVQRCPQTANTNRRTQFSTSGVYGDVKVSMSRYLSYLCIFNDGCSYRTYPILIHLDIC